ncbi:MAG: glycosyltransferase family 4 protein [Chthoniobacteraceae bacterium]
MKILLSHSTPFFLAHGGLQTQIEQTKAALEAIGVEVEYVRWWDEHQTGDIIQYFGRPSVTTLRMAHEKGIKVVLSELLTGQGSRPAWKHWCYRWAMKSLGVLLPSIYSSHLATAVYGSADGIIALTSWEGHLMEYLFGANPAKVKVVPNGVEKPFFDEPPRERGKWLICTATVTERKRVLELAEAAAVAQTPLWIIGKPYSEEDDYYHRFQQAVKHNPTWIRYEGPINDRQQMARIYREARGFVLMSTMESLSLSALEAAACKCPLLLSDLPWARTTFGRSAEYCPITSPSKTATYLRRFYDAAPTITPSLQPATWIDIAQQLKKIYEELLSTSR